MATINIIRVQNELKDIVINGLFERNKVVKCIYIIECAKSCRGNTFLWKDVSKCIKMKGQIIYV